MRRALRRAPAALIAVLIPTGCRHAPPPLAQTPARYTLETAWHSPDGAWFYPRERLDGAFSGLATAMAPPTDGRLTDGRADDPAVPEAAVQSLQLPVVLRVTDLLTGRRILVRADQRGPAAPSRVLALNARAMSLLGMDPSVATPVAFEIDPALSTEAEQSAVGAPHLDIATDPAGAVQQQSLGPPGAEADAPTAPPGATPQGDRTRTQTGAAPQAETPLPQTVTTVPVGPVVLFVDLGTFSSRSIARDIAMRGGGDVDVEGQGRSATYRVRAGPFERTDEADAALDRARRGGISGARITVGGD